MPAICIRLRNTKELSLYYIFISKEISILLKLDEQAKEIIRNPQPEKQVKEKRKEKGEWKQKKKRGQMIIKLNCSMD